MLKVIVLFRQQLTYVTIVLAYQFSVLEDFLLLLQSGNDHILSCVSNNESLHHFLIRTL